MSRFVNPATETSQASFSRLAYLLGLVAMTANSPKLRMGQSEGDIALEPRSCTDSKYPASFGCLFLQSSNLRGWADLSTELQRNSLRGQPLQRRRTGCSRNSCVCLL